MLLLTVAVQVLAEERVLVAAFLGAAVAAHVLLILAVLASAAHWLPHSRTSSRIRVERLYLKCSDIEHLKQEVDFLLGHHAGRWLEGWFRGCG